MKTNYPLRTDLVPTTPLSKSAFGRGYFQFLHEASEPPPVLSNLVVQPENFLGPVDENAKDVPLAEQAHKLGTLMAEALTASIMTGKPTNKASSLRSAVQELMIRA
jgi:hypothetical protein